MKEVGGLKKTLLCKGILIGACVGGALTLFDQNTRNQTVATVKCTTSKTRYYLKHPAKALENCDQHFETVTNLVNNSKEFTVTLVDGFQAIIKEVEQRIESKNE
jgi:hypothetical protein